MGWLTDYLQYTERHEAPERFHFWCGITTIAAALNRKVWLPRVSDGIERYRIYPGQLMTILVAGSGRMRKSTALLLPDSLLRSINVRILSGKTSPEKLLSMLGDFAGGNKKGIITIFASELSVFLSKQQYADPLIDIITDLADAPDRKDFPTQKGGDITVRDACITFLGATTPSSLAEAVPPRAHAHGFMSRFVFVYEQTTPRKESLSETRVDQIRMAEVTRLKTSLVDGLKQMATFGGPIDFTDDGRLWYDDWYNNVYANAADANGEGWASRRHDHMLRVGCCISAGENALRSGKIELTSGVLQAADGALEAVEQDHPRAFAQIGQHASSRGLDRIVEVIRRHGYRVLSKTLHAECIRYYPDPRSLVSALAGLKASGIVGVVSAGTHSEAWYLSGTVGDPSNHAGP